MKVILPMSLMTAMMFMLMSNAFAEQVNKQQGGAPNSTNQQIAQFEINPFVDQQRAMLKETKVADNLMSHVVQEKKVRTLLNWRRTAKR